MFGRKVVAGHRAARALAQNDREPEEEEPAPVETPPFAYQYKWPPTDLRLAKLEPMVVSRVFWYMYRLPPTLSKRGKELFIVTTQCRFGFVWIWRMPAMFSNLTAGRPLPAR